MHNMGRRGVTLQWSNLRADEVKKEFGKLNRGAGAGLGSGGEVGCRLGSAAAHRTGASLLTPHSAHTSQTSLLVPCHTMSLHTPHYFLLMSCHTISLNTPHSSLLVPCHTMSLHTPRYFLLMSCHTISLNTPHSSLLVPCHTMSLHTPHYFLLMSCHTISLNTPHSSLLPPCHTHSPPHYTTHLITPLHVQQKCSGGFRVYCFILYGYGV